MRAAAMSEGATGSTPADEVLSLPIGPHFTDEQQHRVIDALTAPGAF